MSRLKTSTSLIVIIALAATALSSLSGPEPPPPEPPYVPPPIEDLIPPGERRDNSAAIRVLLGDDVVEMTMERYLFGVTAAEMLASFEIEALKAQAVAARTNAIYTMEVLPKTRHPDAHVCGDPSCCTAYKDDERLRAEWGEGYVGYISRIISAVIETDGVYISYDNEPILAVFHSSSAWKTETSGNVWLNDLPYLLNVFSPETEDDVPNYVLTVKMPFGDFCSKILETYPDAVFDNESVPLVSGIKHTNSGRVYEMIIGGVQIKATTIRSMFDLRSTAFLIEFKGDEVVFTTTGFGHGVGMSQYGANVMAASGSGYEEILKHYYTGIELTNQH